MSRPIDTIARHRHLTPSRSTMCRITVTGTGLRGSFPDGAQDHRGTISPAACWHR